MQVIYNHVALPPVGIQLGKVYNAIEKDDVVIINDIELKKETFKVLFKEVGQDIVNKKADVKVKTKANDFVKSVEEK